MSFYRKIKYYLVHTLKYTNKKAQELIDSGQIEIDGLSISENCLLKETSEIKVNGKIEREKTEYVYLKFYKPKGFESTLNTSIENNLSDFFKEYKQLAIAGRLDKQSEGLLLLSNDGKWVEKICHPDFEKEKEYEVKLDKPADSLLLEGFKNGVQIGRHFTKPAICEIIEASTIKVILTEGKNRQIRRMCEKLTYRVVNLKRIRIDNFLLGDLTEGETQSFSFTNH